MTAQRLRPTFSFGELVSIYGHKYDHRVWPDHIVRIEQTTDFTKRLLVQAGLSESAADLSCGDGAVLDALSVSRKFYGDFTPGYELTGDIMETIQQIPVVDVFINTETLEHVDDPGTLLKAIREKTRLLVLSTPVNAWNDDNLQHLWAWSREDVEEMLTIANFEIVAYKEIGFKSAGSVYDFGVWGCR
jgi:hypothetical protein